MRAFAFVLLSLAAVNADSDAYTIGQVASGLTNGGVVTGVDYSNGVVSGLGAIGNRAYAGHVGYAGVGHLGYANQVVAAPAAYGYSGVVASPAYAGLGYGYAGHYGKREAEAEAEADSDAYTIGQVAAGLPVANAYATGHAHNVGVVTGTTYAAPAYARYCSYAAPAYAGYAGVGHVGYATPAAYGYARHYGKREAEADSDAYTIGQVAAGLPVANAYATGHAHNVGVVTGTTYAAPTYAGYSSYAAPAYAGYRSYAAPAYAGYAGVGHVGYSTPAAYGYARHYGKREAEADSDAYTIGQVAAGLPVANAYATGHAHNVGVVTGTTYSAPTYAGYTSYAAPAYAGRVGHVGYAGRLGYAGLGYSGLGYTGAYYG